MGMTILGTLCKADGHKYTYVDHVLTIYQPCECDQLQFNNIKNYDALKVNENIQIFCLQVDIRYE